jgi:hypothetical protein
VVPFTQLCSLAFARGQKDSHSPQASPQIDLSLDAQVGKRLCAKLILAADVSALRTRRGAEREETLDARLADAMVAGRDAQAQAGIEEAVRLALGTLIFRRLKAQRLTAAPEPKEAWGAAEGREREARITHAILPHSPRHVLEFHAHAATEQAQRRICRCACRSCCVGGRGSRGDVPWAGARPCLGRRAGC